MPTTDITSREARITAALQTMPPEIRRYFAGRRLTDPSGRCRCGKQAWGSEQEATAALTAARKTGHYPDTARVYKCPAMSRWHIATRGFHTAALKSRARILAWYLCGLGLIDLAEIVRREFRIPRWSDNTSLSADVNVMVHAGLAAWEPDRPGYLGAADKAGLLRVCQIGLREYLMERYSAEQS